MFKYSKYFLLATAPVILAACSSSTDGSDSQRPVSSDDAKIIAGTDTEDSTAVGALDGKNCTASLIGSRVILTAAHCVKFDKTQAGLGDASNPPSGSSSWRS